MTSRKNSLSRTDAGGGRETYIAELTPGQLVIGVCIIISFGLACFMLGVLVGRYQPAERIEMAQLPPDSTDSDALSAMPSESDAASAPSSGDDVPAATRSVLRAPPPPGPRASSDPEPEVAEEPDVRVEEAEDQPSDPLPKPAAPLDPPHPDSEPLAAPSDLSESGAKPDPPPLRSPAGEEPSGPAPVNVPETIASRLETAPEEPLTVDSWKIEAPNAINSAEPASGPDSLGASARSAPAGSSVEGGVLMEILNPTELAWMVQIGVFSVKENAGALQKKVETATEYSVELRSLSPPERIVVFVGPFPNRENAMRARAILRDEHGFKDCFVKKREP